MTTVLVAPRRHLFLKTSQLARHRCVSTLANSPHVHVFRDPRNADAHLLTLLPTDPPTPDLAIGSTTRVPPTPDSVTENPRFLDLVHETLAAHAARDPAVQASAAAFASSGGASLGSGGAFFSDPGAGARDRRRRQQQRHGQATGGGGVGGFVHVADARNPPDWGRTAWPEDIFGSVQVDGQGTLVGPGGGYQRSGTYRVCTHEGVLGLSEYMRERVLDRLRELEAMVKSAQKGE